MKYKHIKLDICQKCPKYDMSIADTGYCLIVFKNEISKNKNEDYVPCDEILWTDKFGNITPVLNFKPPLNCPYLLEHTLESAQ